MTDDNLFNEVKEDLERQRLEAFWRQYGMLIVAAAVIVVAGTGAYTLWNDWKTKQQQTATGQLIAIVEQTNPDPEKQITALQSLAQKNAGETQATFAQLHAAAIAQKAGKKDEAIKIYDAIAASDKTATVFRQFADLMSVQVQMDHDDPTLLNARLQPLTDASSPWRYSAMEYQGYLALRTGDKAKAKQIFTSLSQDASAPRSLSARAGDVLRTVSE